jgi:hypothetical protein
MLALGMLALGACKSHHDDGPRYATHAIALPGAGSDGVGMDLVSYDPHTDAVWVPAGNTGAVDVLDVSTGKLAQVTGFATAELERDGKKRVVGPSAASVGDHVVYIGNRADSSVCAVDEKTLVKGACVTLDARPDCIAYVAPTHEVWVTTPGDKSIRILDAATLTQKSKIQLAGEPEGVAVDAKRSRFYTNLEDKDQTLAIDLGTHDVASTWAPKCGEDGPHCIRLDEPSGQLFVACTAKVETMDVAHDGAIVGSVDTGEGVDDFDYLPSKHMLFIGASRAGRMTVASVAASGALSIAATVPTQTGARNGAVDARGTMYLEHGKAGELIAVSAK